MHRVDGRVYRSVGGHVPNVHFLCLPDAVNALEQLLTARRRPRCGSKEDHGIATWNEVKSLSSARDAQKEQPDFAFQKGIFGHVFLLLRKLPVEMEVGAEKGSSFGKKLRHCSQHRHVHPSHNDASVTLVLQGAQLFHQLDHCIRWILNSFIDELLIGKELLGSVFGEKWARDQK